MIYGWIDSQKAAYDERYSLQRFTERRARSKWSQDNCSWASTLIEQGRMQPSGLAEVERAKKDGRWQAAYASQCKMEVAPDFQQLFDQNPIANAFFSGLSAVNRYAIQYRIYAAKRPETRAQRMRKFIEMLQVQKTIY